MIEYRVKRTKRLHPIPTESIAELYGNDAPRSSESIKLREKMQRWEERKVKQRERSLAAR
jgi:hypothetical protein